MTPILDSPIPELIVAIDLDVDRAIRGICIESVLDQAANCLAQSIQRNSNRLLVRIVRHLKLYSALSDQTLQGGVGESLDRDQLCLEPAG